MQNKNLYELHWHRDDAVWILSVQITAFFVFIQLLGAFKSIMSCESFQSDFILRGGGLCWCICTQKTSECVFIRSVRGMSFIFYSLQSPFTQTTLIIKVKKGLIVTRGGKFSCTETICRDVKKKKAGQWQYEVV